MYSSICNKNGISLIEVLITLFLISFGMLGLISLQPKAWSLSGRSDYLGRAAGILQKELETSEALLLNPCNPNPCSVTNPSITSTKNVLMSGLSVPQAGDASFTVQTTITDNGDNTWTVVIQVTWPMSLAGISESLVVTQQEIFRSPVGCV